jgi:hypothetical protein
VLFDFYIMADWSGGARRRGGRSDSIQLTEGWILGALPTGNKAIKTCPPQVVCPDRVKTAFGHCPQLYIVKPISQVSHLTRGTQS